jgi:exopolyphosphatase/guanosine-5'-triphosphate,3'-diphosphate pyrophosphatase
VTDADRDGRRRSVLALGKRFEAEEAAEAHGRHVARLALRLFDVTRDLHGLGTDEREVLEYAALLHDVGRAISYSRHHKHSYYLITHGELEGFEPEEVRMIAATARFHRGAVPRSSHAEFTGLSTRAATIVTRLAAILRLADGLDRSHARVVRDLTVLRRNRLVRVYVDSGPDAAGFELWASARAADAWERSFGVSLELRSRIRRRPGSNRGRTPRSSGARRLLMR